jgi:hypothetical protein
MGKRVLRGPLGLWPFPILNFLLSILQVSSLQTSRLTAQNVETWELVRDERGRLVNVVVHRKVEEQ